MNILVTGGAGFIGSHIADAYIREGHRVVVMDNLSSGKREQVNPQAKFYEMDIMSPDVENIFKVENIDAINHHAAQISVTQSVADPLFDAEINILGSLKLMKWAQAYNVQKFIFASTGGALYGEQETYPADEQHPVRPMSPYGIAKLTVERYLEFYRDNFGLQPAMLRYANVYGPRQDPHGEAGVVAIFCKKLIKDQKPVIFGDGEQTRDFVSVFDVAAANLTALTQDCRGSYNIGTGAETSVNTITRLITKASGKNIQPQYDPPRMGEQRRSSIDSARFQEEFGWRPVQPLEEGLKDTFNYFAEIPAQAINPG
ncbi:MAG: NAD-dependent epimerase/dehydratase family protein [Nitrospinaceae bacterium]|nr:NAD-dependent epimerase/dehydratase family protein [Nitrospinaceae bacterium]NIR57964.1 NAD-dependent epimerase/dehydratase family protein [Nitrospinaceae bacterium]NIS88429.1 NAD-dependent epimerase/dehydratase family protein [Nitrospinaceae bacterium]NIT85302.1 NAD-dependent epimerase/dehydratase family protein [Nitrospinaceae bacterium]NIU47460.1 NAD-dependent epimerase/dehydratase family protein [Nitrospinaceae bacterium]